MLAASDVGGLRCQLSSQGKKRRGFAAPMIGPEFQGGVGVEKAAKGIYIDVSQVSPFFWRSFPKRIPSEMKMIVAALHEDKYSSKTALGQIETASL